MNERMLEGRIHHRTDVFSDAIAYQNGVVNLSIDGEAERAWIELVSGNYFSMLGVKAVRGRTFTAENVDPMEALRYE